ncbi:MAG: glycosyltransferase [Victivallaceae bacterium]|nr:glycosyltransferase [Victivallaceae bacterium]
MALVTIVMRSKNDILYIAATFEQILKQKFTDFELLNIDSGSADGTWEVVRKYNPDNSRQIRPEDYIPGKVLNEAVRQAAGKIIVFNNSDCIPAADDWLGKLIRPLLAPGAERISGVFGNQLPRPDAFPLVRKDHERAFGDGKIAGCWEHFFSLASSAALRELLLAQPFREDLQYSEDTDWAWRLKQLGYRPLYVPEAQVEHSHNYPLKELRRRFYQEGVAEGQIYGTKKSFLGGFALPCLAEIGRDLVYLLKAGRLAALPAALSYRVVQRFSAWQGRRGYLTSGRAENGR